MNNLPVLEIRGQKVLTINQLAEIYGTRRQTLTTNMSRNKERFEEGRHYFTIKGEELKALKKRLNRSITLSNTQEKEVIPAKAHVINLWTHEGAVRHCKILETDQAWKQFDLLERTYFQTKQDENESQNLPSTDVSQDWTINLVNNALIGAMNGVHQRFVENEKQVMRLEQTIVETKDIITEQQIETAKVLNEMRDIQLKTMDNVGLKTAGIRKLTDRLKTKLYELTGEKVNRHHWLYQKAVEKLHRKFGVLKWEDIPQHKAHDIFASIDSLECPTHMTF